MKLLLTLILAATGLAVTPTAAVPAVAAGGAAAGGVAAGATDGAAPGKVRLDGVTVRLRAGTRQVVTVNRTKGWHARVTYWRYRSGKWQRAFRTADGRVGYGGLVPARKRVQGSGKTPLGTFRLPWAFGMHRQDDKWDPSYRKVRKGDYWVLDNKSKHYNRYRNKSDGGFRWWLDAGHPDASERLRDYRKQYEFSVVTGFNRRQVRHRGGAIFLHVNGTGATAGCVSAPRWFLRKLMYRLGQERVPVIAIGR